MTQDDKSSPFKCKGNSTASVGDFFGGMVHGALSLFGAGQLVDPMGDATSSLNNAIKTINSQTAVNSLGMFKLEDRERAIMLNFQNVQQEKIHMLMKQQSDELWDAIKQENLFMSVLGMLVLVIIVMMLAKPQSN